MSIELRRIFFFEHWAPKKKNSSSKKLRVGWDAGPLPYCVEHRAPLQPVEHWAPGDLVEHRAPRGQPSCLPPDREAVPCPTALSIALRCSLLSMVLQAILSSIALRGGSRTFLSVREATTLPYCVEHCAPLQPVEHWAPGNLVEHYAPRGQQSCRPPDRKVVPCPTALSMALRCSL